MSLYTRLLHGTDALGEDSKEVTQLARDSVWDAYGPDFIGALQLRFESEIPDTEEVRSQARFMFEEALGNFPDENAHQLAQRITAEEFDSLALSFDD